MKMKDPCCCNKARRVHQNYFMRKHNFALYAIQAYDHRHSSSAFSNQVMHGVGIVITTTKSATEFPYIRPSRSSVKNRKRLVCGNVGSDPALASGILKVCEVGGCGQTGDGRILASLRASVSEGASQNVTNEFAVLKLNS